MTTLTTIANYYTTGIALGREYLPFVEEGFDYFGYVPIVSTIAGGFRIQYGTVQMVAGIALSVLAGLSFILTQKEEFRKGSISTLDIVVHGAVNVCRGFIECHRYINLICPLHDYFVRGLDLRITYQKPIFTRG
ncbi:MAG TPA: hypothetical protein PKW79_03005 [Rhabdochlamydiaceae bacterium]|nr:hypothetical protein [Rhabdochlamydiaceae bacterium]